MGGDATAGPASVTSRTLELATAPTATVDVLFDDQRVLSAAPREFHEQHSGCRLDWPVTLWPFLRGSTRLVVREHVGGRTLVDAEVSFDAEPHRTAVVDDQGRGLAVDKLGKISPMFDTVDAETTQLLVQTAGRLIADLVDFGVAAFVGYGTLLGAVRGGKLIRHDNDLDLIYFSELTDPASIAFESLAMERFLTGRGWQMDRSRSAFIRAQVPGDPLGSGFIDIFVAFHDGERLYLDQFVWADVAKDSIVPVGQVTLEGIEIAAPRDPAPLLAATYGRDYLVPDPAFKYHRSPELIRATRAWFGNHRLRRPWWERYLQVLHPRPPEVSDLARRAAERLDPDALVVDIGFGHGSDALWLARRGTRVVAVDYVAGSVTALARVAEREGLPVSARQMSLCNVRTCLGLGALLAGEDRPDLTVLMCRDVLDVVEPDARTNFLLLARTALRPGGRALVSFRTALPEADLDQPGVRALDVERFLEEALASGARLLSRDDSAGRSTLELAWR